MYSSNFHKVNTPMCPVPISRNRNLPACLGASWSLAFQRQPLPDSRPHRGIWPVLTLHRQNHVVCSLYIYIYTHIWFVLFNL